MFRRLLPLPTLRGRMYGITLTSDSDTTPLLWLGGPDDAWAAVTNTDAVGSPSTFRCGLATIAGLDYLLGSGLFRTESSLGVYRAAGMPPGLSPLTYSMNAAVHTVLVGAPGTLVPDGSNVAYRVTWHKTENGVTVGGPPTGRLVIRNIAGTSGYAAAVTKNVALRIPLPYRQDSETLQVDTTYFWRLWRSRVSATDTADDEMYQVAEAFVTAGDVVAGYSAFTDQTPDTFIIGQAKLHTNATNYPESGLANGVLFADEPPVRNARDVTFFADCLWMTGVLDRGQLNLQLLSVGFAAGNTIVVNGVTLTAVAGAPVNPGDFTIVGGLATLSLNIEATARNIVDAYNRTAGIATVQAHYVSLGTQAPGNIVFRAHGTTNVFSAQSAAAGALFQPNITTATANTVDFGARNQVRFTKPGRGDSWPLCNSLQVGPSGGIVFRLMPFRERMLCFSTTGLYEITGTDYSNFTVTLVDSTLRLIEQNSVSQVDDAVYALTRQGVVEITDGGQSYVSESIEPTIQAILQSYDAGLALNDYGSTAFSVGDNRNHLYWLFYQTDGAASPYANRWLCFDARSRKWSTGSLLAGQIRGAACIQASTGLVVVANSEVGAATIPARVFVQRNLLDGTTDYNDTSAAGTDTPVSAVATFQWQVPDTDSRQHWQQLQLQFENGEQSFYPRPTGVLLQWATDVVAAVTAVLYTVAAAILRIGTPLNYRRATRQQVTLTHNTAQHVGLVAVNQTVSSAPAPRVTK